MWYRVIGIAFILSTFFLNKIVSCSQKCHWYEIKFIRIVLLRSFPDISIYFLWFTIHAHPCQQQDGFYFTRQFFFFGFNYIYLKFIKSLQLGVNFDSSISNEIWPHVFRSEVVSYFPIFLVTFLDYIFVFSRMWQLSNYFKDGVRNPSSLKST